MKKNAVAKLRQRYFDHKLRTFPSQDLRACFTKRKVLGMDDREHYVKTIKDLQRKLSIAKDALAAIEIVTDISESAINYQPLKPIVEHNHAVVKEALEKLRE